MQRSLKRTISFSMPSKRLISLKPGRLLAVAKLSVVLMQTVLQAMVSMHFIEEVLMPMAMVTLIRHVVAKQNLRRLLVVMAAMVEILAMVLVMEMANLLTKTTTNHLQINLKNGLKSFSTGLKLECKDLNMILIYIKQSQKIVSAIQQKMLK